MRTRRTASLFPSIKCMDWMVLGYEDQFVPMLTPCSAASFRLKNMRLPRIQRSVGLPRASIIVRTTVELLISPSPITTNTETMIALQDCQCDTVSHEEHIHREVYHLVFDQNKDEARAMDAILLPDFTGFEESEA